MILIDTSAWVEFLRTDGRGPVKERVAFYLELKEAAVTGPVRFELLAGADTRSEADVCAILGLCTELPFEGGYWDVAAHYERTLRARGVRIPREDLLIATVALELGLPLLHFDPHFDLAATTGGLPLRLESA
jgi:predicted nucleic acid-binding protein